MANGTLTWLGHASFRIDSPGEKRIYIDPWPSGPTYPAAEKDPERIDVIVVTHGHGDHAGDAAELGKKSTASSRSTSQPAGSTARATRTGRAEGWARGHGRGRRPQVHPHERLPFELDA